MKTENHKSDCAQHNEPYMENGTCNCGADYKNEIIKLQSTITDLKEKLEFVIHHLEYRFDSGADEEKLWDILTGIKTLYLTPNS